jgi:acyl-coenzyme A thioesterase PaaI-like protein
VTQEDGVAKPPPWIGADSVAPARTQGGVALCGACHLASSCRLGVQREWLEGKVAFFEVSCPRDQEGGPNVAHGGWTAAAMDEMLGHVPLLHNQMSVTATLTVNFRKPVPVERPLAGRAWIDKIEGSKWFISGELLLAPSSSVLATATGIWVARDYSHFVRHEKWLAEQDASGDDSKE